MDLHAYITSLGGVARTRTLIEAGYTKRDIASIALDFKKPARGIIALPGCNPDFLFALLHNGLLTCGSAAEFYGLWIRARPARRHLACAHSRSAAFVAHRTRRFPPHGLLPVASIEDTVLHALGCLDVPQAVSVAESALLAGRIDADMLRACLRGSRSARAREALARVDLTAESEPEVEARLLFQAQGWVVEAQARIPGVGRVDFLIEGRVIVEIDGHAYHSTRERFIEDRRRHNTATLRGLPTLRYPPEVVWNDPGRIVSEVQALLEMTAA